MTGTDVFAEFAAAAEQHERRCALADVDHGQRDRRADHHDQRPSTGGQLNPFDAGRTPCPQGGEDRWSARWLMEQMGYPRWNEFEAVIERAKIAAHNQGFNGRILFRVNAEKTGGRPLVDYQLTRFAAYLVAMNGDPRKPEVAAAQAYFVIKTREAETATVAATIAIPRTYAEALRAAADEHDRANLAEAKVAELEPKAEFYDDLMEADGTYTMQAVANIIGWGRNVMMRELRRKGVLQGNNLPYRRWAHHFKVIPGTRTHPNGDLIPTATTHVIPSGIPFIQKKLVGALELAVSE